MGSTTSLVTDMINFHMWLLDFSQVPTFNNTKIQKTNIIKSKKK